jgi:hyperosmotically inducible protein
MDNIMFKTKTTSCLAGVLLIGSCAPLLSHASDDVDVDRGHPTAFVKDSAVTMKIKSKLAADHLTSAAHIHVDTDAAGIVWLTGTARSEAEVARAVSIARDTEHVVSVKNNLSVKKDD